MDEVIESIAYDLSQKYGKNTVEQEALYAVIVSKLHKEKDKWRKLSSLSTFLKTTAYNTIINYKLWRKSWNDTICTTPLLDVVYTDEGCDRVETDSQDELLLSELTANTTLNEYEVICKTFGIGGFEKKTREEILEELYITESEQRTIIRNVFDRLKTNKIIMEIYKAL